MSDVLRGKAISKRAFLRGFADEPLACLLEWILSDAFELERGTPWFDLLLEAEEAQNNGQLPDGIDTMLSAMFNGIAIGVLVEDGHILRIIEDKYQKAMDIAGVWYDPYVRSTNEEAYRLSDKGAAMLSEYGEEGAALILAKEFSALKAKQKRGSA